MRTNLPVLFVYASMYSGVHGCALCLWCNGQNPLTGKVESRLEGFETSLVSHSDPPRAVSIASTSLNVTSRLRACITRFMWFERISVLALTAVKSKTTATRRALLCVTV